MFVVFLVLLFVVLSEVVLLPDVEAVLFFADDVVLLPDVEVVLFFAALLLAADDVVLLPDVDVVLFFADDVVLLPDVEVVFFFAVLLPAADGFFVADGAAVPAGFFEPAEAEADGAAVAGCFPTVTYCGDAL